MGNKTKRNKAKQKVVQKKEQNLSKKVIILAYLLVLFIPPLGALDVMNTQWLYVALINFFSFGYILFNPSQFDLSFHNKLSKYVFLGSAVFVGIALLSFTKSMVISESVVHLTFLLNTLLAFFVFYTIVKENPSTYFEYIAFLFVVFLGIEGYQLVSYFVENNHEPRSVELVGNIPRQVYGNRNILATSLAIKLFFTVYFYTKIKKPTRFLFLLVFILGTAAVILTGTRTAIYSLPIIISALVFGYLFFSDRDSKITGKLGKIVLPLLLACVAALYLSLSVNKIIPGQLNSISDMVFDKSKASIEKKREKLKKQAVFKKNMVPVQKTQFAGIFNPSYVSMFGIPTAAFEENVSNDNINYFNDSGRELFWFSGMETFKQNPIIGSGLGQWKLIEKPSLIRERGGGGYFYPRRVHNDFLQIGYEMGLLGFIPFLGFFAIVFYVLVMGILKGEEDTVRLKNLFLLCAFIAFSIDSFINFPSERPSIQMEAFAFLALVLAFTQKDFSFKIKKPILILFLLVSSGLIYTNYNMFISSKMDLNIRDWDKGFNMFTQKYPMSYNELVDKYSGFPDLHGLGKPKEIVMAKFAYSEGRYKTAMNHLNRAIKMTPYQQEHKALKAVIFELNKGMKNPDSSYHYAKMVFRRQPSLKNMEEILKLTHKRKRDSRSVLQFLKEHME